MNIKIVAIRDKGIVDKERIVLKALSNLDLGYFMIFLTSKLGDTTFEGSPDKVFWFPDKEIKKDDFVILYTKSGRSTEIINKNGTKSHFFYWELNPPIFNKPNKIAVVIEANGWLQGE